jgi:type IV secretion system protein VirD4
MQLAVPGLALALPAAGAAALAGERFFAPGQRVNSHGDSRWARGRELRQLRAQLDRLDGAVIGWHGSHVLRLPDEDNLLVFGVQRSGKTSTVVVPGLLNWPGAVVATSTKEELVRLTGRHRTRFGSVSVLAPLDEDTAWISRLGLRAVSWNPVADLAGSGSAAELADVFTADGKMLPSAHWYHSAANLLTGLFLLARQRNADLAAVLDVLNSTALPGYVALGNEAGGRARAILHGFARTPREEAGSVMSTARAALSVWLDDRVAAATSSETAESALDLDNLLAEGGTLYLVAPAEDADRCRPLFTALLGSLLRRATARARTQDGLLSPRLLLALDEAANFARVPRLASYVSTGPGQGIQAVLCFHDLAQLRANYGTEAAATIWNNCRARLLLPGQADLSTLELFSKSMGNETVLFRSRSWNKGGRSTSEARNGRPLLSLDQLRRSSDPVLVFSSAPPARLKGSRWDQVPRWRALVDASRSAVAQTA